MAIGTAHHLIASIQNLITPDAVIHWANVRTQA
jgi:hypothetical protein